MGEEKSSHDHRKELQMSDTEVVVSPETTSEEKHGLSTAARRKARVNRTKHSKRYLALVKGVDPDLLVDPVEALNSVKEKSSAKFDETIEIAVNLGVDPRHGDQMVRGATNLPHGTGKSRVVWVFARGAQAEAALAAGADVVGAEDLVERIQKEGGASCDITVATPDMMPLVGRVGQVLKQKMPNPKAGTVSPNIAQVVQDIKKATRLEYRVDKNGIVHAPVGKASYTTEYLMANLLALVNALVKTKPAASKGKYLRKVTLSSTMGPGVKVDIVALQKLLEKV